MNWKLGQELICVDDNYKNTELKSQCNAPNKGDVVILDKITQASGEPRITLVGVVGNLGQEVLFHPKYFAPLETRRDAKKDLLNQFIEVVESPDCPIQTPQTV